MKHTFGYLLPIAMSMMACRLDNTAEIQTELPGTYSRSKESASAKVEETIEIGNKQGPGDDFPVTTHVTVSVIRKGKWVKDAETRQLTGRYNRSTRELLLVERGKTYRVDLQKQMITDEVDTLRRTVSRRR